jgi:hypothetical protein
MQNKIKLCKISKKMGKSQQTAPFYSREALMAGLEEPRTSWCHHGVGAIL